MGRVQATQVPDYVDAKTGIPKAELRRMLDNCYRHPKTANKRCNCNRLALTALHAIAWLS